MLDEIMNSLKKSLNFGNNRKNQSNPISKLFNFNTPSRSRNLLNYKLVNYEEARAMIEGESVLLLDVRSKAEYEVMHIKNATNMPVNEIDKQVFTYSQDQSIMIYCTTGTRSKNAIQILNSLGYSNIFIWEYAAIANFPYKDMLVYN